MSDAFPKNDFETFRSNVCHRVKDTGDYDFIITILQSDEVRRYWNEKQYFKAFYLLAMMDYLSCVHGIPLCKKYDDIRSQSLESTIYPRDVLLTAKLSPELDRRQESKEKSIPEFIRFNIVEINVRDIY